MPESGSDLGRFSEPALLVLISLSDAPKHGYAIMLDVADFSGVSIGPGTLYGVLARLESRGLIEGVETDDRRRPYRITGAGVEAVAGHLGEMGRVLGVGRSRLRQAAG